jgi:hypothetical protein
MHPQQQWWVLLHPYGHCLMLLLLLSGCGCFCFCILG